MSVPVATPALPADLAAGHVKILARRAKRIEAEAAASSFGAVISHLKLTIDKLRREFYGERSELTVRLIDQMELQLEELEARASEDEIAAQERARLASQVLPPHRSPVRKPFPEHLPRERVILPAPATCPCCRSMKLSRLGEDVTETLEILPRPWKVIQTVREKFTCRQCGAITQPPAPFHVTPRGFIGANLLATALLEKFGQHQPLNRRSKRGAPEGIDVSVSRLANQVGTATVALKALHDLIAPHVMAAKRLHTDDTPVPTWSRARPIRAESGPMYATITLRRPRPAGRPLLRRARQAAGASGRAPRGLAGILQADAYGG